MRHLQALEYGRRRRSACKGDYSIGGAPAEHRAHARAPARGVHWRRVGHGGVAQLRRLRLRRRAVVRQSAPAGGGRAPGVRLRARPATRAGLRLCCGIRGAQHRRPLRPRGRGGGRCGVLRGRLRGEGRRGRGPSRAAGVGGRGHGSARSQLLRHARLPDGSARVGGRPHGAAPRSRHRHREPERGTCRGAGSGAAGRAHRLGGERRQPGRAGGGRHCRRAPRRSGDQCDCNLPGRPPRRALLQRSRGTRARPGRAHRGAEVRPLRDRREAHPGPHQFACGRGYALPGLLRPPWHHPGRFTEPHARNPEGVELCGTPRHAALRGDDDFRRRRGDDRRLCRGLWRHSRSARRDASAQAPGRVSRLRQLRQSPRHHSRRNGAPHGGARRRRACGR